jgi:hypothetical protein
LAAVNNRSKLTFDFMNVVFVQRLGTWAIILTLLFGIFLLGNYLMTRDVEAGTLLYFYIIFAGIVNSIAFLSLLILSFLFKGNKRNFRIKAVIIALTYLGILTAAYFIF